MICWFFFFLATATHLVNHTCVFSWLKKCKIYPKRFYTSQTGTNASVWCLKYDHCCRRSRATGRRPGTFTHCVKLLPSQMLVTWYSHMSYSETLSNTRHNNFLLIRVKNRKVLCDVEWEIRTDLLPALHQSKVNCLIWGFGRSNSGVRLQRLNTVPGTFTHDCLCQGVSQMCSVSNSAST